MTFDFEKYHDDIVIPSTIDNADYRRFPVSFAHLVQLDDHDEEPSYAVRVRQYDRTLKFIYGPSPDYSAMREKLDYVRMNMSVRRVGIVPRAHGVTMNVLATLWSDAVEPAFDRESYHAEPLVPRDGDEKDFRQFPISHAHLVRFEGPDGTTLYNVRCRNALGKLKFLYELTPNLADIREELEYVQVNFMVGQTMAKPFAHSTTVTMLNAFWRDRRIDDGAATNSRPGAPGFR